MATCRGNGIAILEIGKKVLMYKHVFPELLFDEAWRMCTSMVNNLPPLQFVSLDQIHHALLTIVTPSFIKMNSPEEGVYLRAEGDYKSEEVATFSLMAVSNDLGLVLKQLMGFRLELETVDYPKPSSNLIREAMKNILDRSLSNVQRIEPVQRPNSKNKNPEGV